MQYSRDLAFAPSNAGPQKADYALLHLMPDALDYEWRLRKSCRPVVFGTTNLIPLLNERGPIHGRPVTTSTMTRRLRAIGLEPAPARSTAVGQLAMQLPPVILARLTGVTVARAAVWHAATSASQARNLLDGP